MANFDISAVLDAAQNRLDVKSDYKLSQVTGIRTSSLSNYRVGKSLPDEPTCKILADAAGIDADVLTAQVQAARCKSEAAAAVWSRIAYRLERASLAAVPAIFAALISIDSIAPDASAAQVARLLTPSAWQSAVYTSYVVFALVIVGIFYPFRDGSKAPKK